MLQTNRIAQFLAALLVAGLAPQLAGSARAEVAPAQKVKVLLTALSFDRSLKERAGDKVVIGVLGACDTSSALLEASGKSINGVPIAVQSVGDFKGEAELGGDIKNKNISVLFVCAASDEAVGSIASAAKKHNVVTLADNAAWVEEKLVLGVGEKDGRPELVLNANAAKAAGAEFDPRIFGVARVVK